MRISILIVLISAVFLAGAGFNQLQELDDFDQTNQRLLEKITLKNKQTSA